MLGIDVAQMERVMISYVSVDVVVTTSFIQHAENGEVFVVLLTRLSIRANFKLINHDDDLYTDPDITLAMRRKTAWC